MSRRGHGPSTRRGRTGLARYFDYGSGPVPEMADDSTYYPDVIRSLVEHPSAVGKTFLVKGSEASRNATEAARLKADKLRRKCERGVHARMVWRLPVEPRIL